MWLFKWKERTKCEICGRKLTLLEWKDLGNTDGRSPEDDPYRCSACNRIFCFDCLNKRHGQKVGRDSYVLEFICPTCGSSSIKYAFTKPLPESPEELVRRKAKELQIEHGELVKVRCIAQNSIELIYRDGRSVDERLGEQERQITCGYAGTGPTLFHTFLTESGFQISLDEVFDKHPPYILQHK